MTFMIIIAKLVVKKHLDMFISPKNHVHLLKWSVMFDAISKDQLLHNLAYSNMKMIM